MDSDQNPSKTKPYVAESHPLETVGGLVHPHQLEVQDFSAYALIVDARADRDFADDHIPAAVNLPVLSEDQHAEVEAQIAADRDRALQIGAGHARSTMAAHLGPVFAELAPGERVLVYGAGGDMRGALCADALRDFGYVVDELLGGWRSYRRWVSAGLTVLPRLFLLRVLGGPVSCGQSRLLTELSRQGQQTLDLMQIAAHYGSLLGPQLDQHQPPQPLFESLLLDALRHRDAWRPLWVMAARATLGALQLPVELFDAIQRAPTYEVTAPMTERITFWSETYPQDAADPLRMVEGFASKVHLIGSVRLIDWRRLALAGQTDSLVEEVLTREDEIAATRSVDAATPRPASRATIHLASREGSIIAAAVVGLQAHPDG